jgi:DNA polymerase alpha-associated DNA helicase A
MSLQSINIPEFAETQISLLQTELESEIGETAALVASHSPAALQRAGLALINLTVSSRRTGLGGKTVLELCPDAATSGSSDGGSDLPEHGIRPGDIVLLSEQPAGSAKKREVKELEKKGARGVITRVRRGDVGIALDEEREEGVPNGRLWLVKLADEVTHKRWVSNIPFRPIFFCDITKQLISYGIRMRLTMEKLQKKSESEWSMFIRVVFGLSTPSSVPENLASDPYYASFDWVDPTLNESQKNAILFALESREIALIHGPPGVCLQISRNAWPSSTDKL